MVSSRGRGEMEGNDGRRAGSVPAFQHAVESVKLLSNQINGETLTAGGTQPSARGRAAARCRVG